jgi:hypothetical protein
MTASDFEKMDIELERIEKRNWFQRTFVDFHLPWWCSCVLYGTGYVAYAFCIYTSLLYGVSFRDEKVTRGGEEPFAHRCFKRFFFFFFFFRHMAFRCIRG